MSKEKIFLDYLKDEKDFYDGINSTLKKAAQQKKEVKSKLAPSMGQAKRSFKAIMSLKSVLEKFYRSLN